MGQKLTDERAHCLKWWDMGGWSIGQPMRRGIGKWEHHIKMLEKAGLLEGDEYGMHRLTEAGRAALSSASKPGER